MRDTLGDCSIDFAADLYNMVRGSRSLPDDVKDSLVASLLRTRPEVAKLRAELEEKSSEGPGAVDERVIYVTSEGYIKFEAEYNILVNDDIPKNAAEINRAASYGDLSENAEWSAAIEKQSALTQRAEEMREALEKARVIDASTVQSENVAVGSEVRLTNLDSNVEETYTLLGPWDADMDLKIISYLSPLGRTLLGHVIGDEAEVIIPAGTSHYRIEDIKVSALLIEKSQQPQS